MNTFMFLTFFYMFIVLSTFYIYHYKLYSHRETCAAKCTKSPAAEFCPCGGAAAVIAVVT